MAEQAEAIKTIEGKVAPKGPAIPVQEMAENLRNQVMAMPPGRRNWLLASVVGLIAIKAGCVTCLARLFRVPLPAWLRGELSAWGEEVLRLSPLRELGLFDFDHIMELWRRHQTGPVDHSFDLWCLINLSGWYEHWFKS